VSQTARELGVVTLNAWRKSRRGAACAVNAVRQVCLRTAQSVQQTRRQGCTHRALQQRMLHTVADRTVRAKMMPVPRALRPVEQSMPWQQRQPLRRRTRLFLSSGFLAASVCPTVHQGPSHQVLRTRVLRCIRVPRSVPRPRRRAAARGAGVPSPRPPTRTSLPIGSDSCLLLTAHSACASCVRTAN
jgi:hypothetical protein